MTSPSPVSDHRAEALRLAGVANSTENSNPALVSAVLALMYATLAAGTSVFDQRVIDTLREVQQQRDALRRGVLELLSAYYNAEPPGVPAAVARLRELVGEHQPGGAR